MAALSQLSYSPKLMLTKLSWRARDASSRTPQSRYYGVKLIVASPVDPLGLTASPQTLRGDCDETRGRSMRSATPARQHANGLPSLSSAA